MTHWTLCKCGHDRVVHERYLGECSVQRCCCITFRKAPGQVYPWEPGTGNLPEGVTSDEALYGRRLG